MPGPSGELCKHCYHWVAASTKRHGDCHYHPAPMTRVAGWWCGQFKPRPESRVGACNEDNPVTDDSEIPADRPVCKNCRHWNEKTTVCSFWEGYREASDFCKAFSPE